MAIKMEEILKEIFNDDREIVGVHDKNFDEEILLTEDDELIIFKIQTETFDRKALAEYVELLEEVYFYFQKHINLYILMQPNIDVTVEECDIYSKAHFNIVVGRESESSKNNRNLQCDFAIDVILSKIKDKDINMEDIEILEMLPIVCDEKDKKHYRIISASLITLIGELCLI